MPKFIANSNLPKATPRSTPNAPRSRVTIVIPVFNQVGLTDQCLRTIVGRERCETIVVDDASTDSTQEMLASIGKSIKVVKHDLNSGFAQSCNDGAAVAQGDYLVFLNNDTIPQPGWLEALVRYADLHPEAAVVGAKLLYPNNTIQHAGVVICQDRYPRHIYSGFPSNHPAVCTSRPFQIVTAACMLVRQRAFAAMGGFRTTFHNGFEDVDLCLRLRQAQFEIHYCADSVLYHLEGASPGRRKHEGDNYRLYSELWADHVQPDDLTYYVQDQLISLCYEGSLPFHLKVAPILAVLDSSAREFESEQLLMERARQVADLTRENMHLRVALGRHAPRVPAFEYQRLRERIRETVLRTVPHGATVLVVSKGDRALLELDGRKGWHFPQTEKGAYAGYHPADSAAAISHLEQLRKKGADYLVFPNTAFWWLNHYKEFRNHLENRCRPVLNTPDTCAIFELGRALPRLVPSGKRCARRTVGAEVPLSVSLPQRRKPRVLYVCHNHPNLIPGGAEVYAYELYEAMRVSGKFEPTFLARADSTPNLTPALAEGSVIRPCGSTGKEQLFYTKKSEFDAFYLTSRNGGGCARRFREFLLEEKPDLVHFQHTHLMGADLVSEARRALPDAAIIYTLHEYLPICHRNGLMVRSNDMGLCNAPSAEACHRCFPDISVLSFSDRKKVIQEHFSHVDVFLAPSQFLLELYVAWGIPRDKIQHEEYGRRRFLPLKNAEEDRPRNRFAFFGQLNWFKGITVLLNAMRILAERASVVPNRSLAEETPNQTLDSSACGTTPHLWIHGANLELQGEEFREEFERSLDAIRDHVTFVGPYPQDELPNRMANIDWVVVPSIWWENSPLVIQEAFGHGRPVICSGIGAMQEKVQDGRNGLHFRMDDPMSLAETMKRAMTTPGLWDSLVDGIPKPHVMEQHLAVLTQLYNRILETKLTADTREKEHLKGERSKRPVCAVH